MATLTVDFPAQIETITFSNGETAKNTAGYRGISFTSAVTIKSLALAYSYRSWTGTLYWGKTSGAKTWKFATVTNGSVSILSSHEQIDCTGNRTIYITAEAGSSSTYKTMSLYVPYTISSITVHANNNYYPKTLTPDGTYQDLDNLPSSGSLWIGLSDITPATGYGPPYTYRVTDSNGAELSSGTISSTTYISIASDARIFIAAAKASYAVKVVFGDGIKQVGFGVNVDSPNNLATTDFTQEVGAGGYLYISIGSYTENHSYPVTATPSSGSSWTVVKADGTYNDHKISAPSSAGTRTVTLTATEYKKYYCRVHAYGNGGTFASGSDNYYTNTITSETVSIDFDTTKLETPTRAGYTFLGWGYSSNATQYYNGTIPISATSQSSGSPTIYNLYAIWEKTEYSAYIKLGAGISSAAVYVDGALKSDIRDKLYHKIAVNLLSTISIKSIAKESGYGLPYTVSFYASAIATSPTTSFEDSNVEVSYSYTGSRVYAELSAKKEKIDLFYWSSASVDATLIAKGKPVKNLTAVRWNRLKAKIQELAAAEGESYSYSEVSTGSTIKATEFNAVRSAIMNRSGYGTLPEAQTKGNPILAALFNGTNSLKSGINAAITNYNNS